MGATDGDYDLRGVRARGSGSDAPVPLREGVRLLAREAMQGREGERMKRFKVTIVSSPPRPRQLEHTIDASRAGVAVNRTLDRFAGEGISVGGTLTIRVERLADPA